MNSVLIKICAVPFLPLVLSRGGFDDVTGANQIEAQEPPFWVHVPLWPVEFGWRLCFPESAADLLW